MGNFTSEMQEWLTRVAASGKINNLTAAAMFCRAIEKRVCDVAENFGIERDSVKDSFNETLCGGAYELDAELHELLGLEVPASLQPALKIATKTKKKRKQAA